MRLEADTVNAASPIAGCGDVLVDEPGVPNVGRIDGHRRVVAPGMCLERSRARKRRHTCPRHRRAVVVVATRKAHLRIDVRWGIGRAPS